MAIREKDIKLLWARAAGRCSKPGCAEELTTHLEKSGDTVLGEMAHIIGREPTAPRGTTAPPDDRYSNLILLCPTHHTLVDKAPDDFPEPLLREWKADWERVVASVSTNTKERPALFQAIRVRLVENSNAFHQWGPLSDRAIQHPQSHQAASTWRWRRLAVIVPNNRAIVTALRQHQNVLTLDEWRTATLFIEHAEFYERHCIDPQPAEAYLPFPVTFDTMIRQSLA